MDNYLIRLITVSLLIMFVLTTGCKKDEDNLGAVNRITKQSYFENDEIKWIYDYSYKNEKMVATDVTIYIQGTPYNSTWDITYPTDDSIISFFTISGNFPDTRDIIELQNGLPIRRSTADFVNPGFWKTNLIYEYIYQDNHLIEDLEYHGGDGELPDLNGKNVYEYEGNKLVRKLYYSMAGDPSLTAEDTIIYKGDKLDYRIYYDINDLIKAGSRKYIYIYEDNLLTNMGVYKKFSDTEWALEENHLFTYNEFGNLESRSIYLISGAILKYVFEYEEGKGNFRQFINPRDNFWSSLFQPIPD